MPKPRRTYTFTITAAQKAAVATQLAAMDRGRYKVAELTTELESASRAAYFTLSGTFSQADYDRIQAAIGRTAVTRDVDYWEEVGADTQRINRELGLIPKAVES